MTHPDEKAIADVLAAEAARVRAINACDWEALEVFLGDDLTYGHTTGLVETRDENIAHLKTRPRKYKRDNLRVRLYGDVALMNGDIEITAPPGADGSPGRVVDNVALQVWIKRAGRWQMIAFHG